MCLAQLRLRDQCILLVGRFMEINSYYERSSLGKSEKKILKRQRNPRSGRSSGIEVGRSNVSA
jgi:hypothetical protein